MFKIPDRNAENVMRNDAELGKWLNGIPNAPPYLNLDHDHVASLTSKSSLLNPFSNGFHLYGDTDTDASPFQYSPPFLNSNHQTPNHHCYSESSSDKVDISADGLGLSKYFSGMNIWDERLHEQGNGVVGAKIRGYDYDSMDSHTYTCSLDPHSPCFTEQNIGTPYQQHTFNEGTPSSIWGTPDMNWPCPASAKGYTFVPPVEKQGSTTCFGQVQLQNPSFATPYPCDCFLCSQSQSLDAGWHVKSPSMFSQPMQPNLPLNLNSPSPSHCFPATKERARPAANSELSQCLSPIRTGGADPVVFKCDNSFIIQGEDVKYCVDNECMCNSLLGCKENSHNEVATQAVGQKVPQLISHIPGCHENNSNATRASDIPQPLLLNFYSLAEVQGFIYHLAKDQNGCRFLQRMVDEGTSEDLRIVFKGVIDNVVELMMDPFGNYLVQKLLDVCREDQRLQIVLMLTKEPGQLVRTSLNTHGTRVVQKLIETLNTRKQVSLVRSAIQPGFLDLIKDLNGNHVIQRCLQCLSCQDNEFIFDAAAKFCVDIATHQHGCCVLQRCIDYSMGKYQDKLVTEICRHGLLLSQDPFGNYVVQYIIEEIPSASAKLISKFKGNYVNLSMQKFSSHVVEKCLKHVGESRSRIVRELLSAPHFDQLLQDPYANYVVQCALGVTKGSLHASLVEAVRPHKILRTSPYCKRIFSRSLLKK